MVTAGYRGGHSSSARLHGARVYLDDPEPPAIDAAPADTGWVGAKTLTAAVTASDAGLGVAQLSLATPKRGGGTTEQSTQHPCRSTSGAEGLDCPGPPPGWTHEFSYNTADMPEGANTVTAHAWDVSSHRSSPRSWTVKVDRTGPVLRLGGSLYDRYRPGGALEREALYDPFYDLEVSAEDTSVAGAAGVSKIEVFVDRVGQAQSTTPVSAMQGQPCLAGGCPLGPHRYTFRSDDFSDGPYFVRVVGTDLAGNSNTETWPVIVDRAGDVYEAVAYTSDPSQGGESIVKEWARYGTMTARSEDPEQLSMRGKTQCESGSAYTDCEAVRELVRMPAGEPDSPEPYSEYRGAAGDPDLPQVSELLEVATRADAAVSRGPIRTAAASWQVLPPAHGQEFETYEDAGEVERVVGVRSGSGRGRSSDRRDAHDGPDRSPPVRRRSNEIPDPRSGTG